MTDPVQTKPELLTSADASREPSYFRQLDSQAINQIRMTDYFEQQPLNEGAIIAMSEDPHHPFPTSEVTAQQIIEKWRSRPDTAPFSSLALSSHQSAPTIETIKNRIEQYEAKLEKDVVDNVETNFIFKKGTDLSSGLIDPNRLFTVMNKLKELAYKQVQLGSKEIDY
jgi:hypothetical protein